MIRLIDIFAGPGGLSEGFAAVRDKRGNRVFDQRLSIETDPSAHETLKLRTFFRSFLSGAPVDYYKFLRQEIGLEAVYEAHPHAAKEAAEKCWKARLGPEGEPTQDVRERIHKALGSAGDWVLIGGPPCQAYSIAGRSRNQGNPKYDPKTDVRQRLYVEYLQILADHRPAVFIMENVKGLLSATLDNKGMFHRILDDLRNPVAALKREVRTSSRSGRCGYRIFSLVEQLEFEDGDVQGAIIRAEDYGIPQARHRVILLGIRDDLKIGARQVLNRQPTVAVSAVITSLPQLRSGLSRIQDSAAAWEKCLREQVNSRWANAGTLKISDTPELSHLLRKSLAAIRSPTANRGGVKGG